MSNSNNNNDAPTVKRNWLSICVTISVLCLIGVLLLIAKEKPLTPNPPEETPTAGSLDELTTNRIDGAEMILIPSGEFIMGSDFIDDEKPVRSVYLDDFYIYKTEVTVAQYSKFCTDTNKKMPEKPEYGWQYNYPIVNVSWENATAYAKWAGVSLPTEAQWEKAARGPNGLVYPWGNKWDSSKCSNYKNGETSEPSPVGSFPAGASFYGVLDMAGNVWEWCADWYGGEYYQNASARNPTGPTTGEVRVLRGGCWDYDYDFNRSATRVFNDPGNWDINLGFRCVYLSPVP